MKIDFTKLSTEQRNPRSLNIDKVSTLEMMEIINNDDQQVALAVKTQLPQIAKTVDACANAIKAGGRVIYIGAGTSGRIGVLDASEMPPTYGVDSDIFIGLHAGGDFALRNSVEPAEDDIDQVVKDLKQVNLNNKDVLIGISASGVTPYVKSGIEYANSLNCITASVSTSLNSLIGDLAKIRIEPVTGPEVIAGSTRMKSGTAQKLVLNMISTGTMIKVGKTCSNLMVDVKCENSKLKNRAARIVHELTGSEFTKIEAILKDNNYDVKNTIVCLKKNVSIQTAHDLLLNNDFILSKII